MTASVARGEKYLTTGERERECSILVSISVSATARFNWRRQFPRQPFIPRTGCWKSRGRVREKQVKEK